MSQQPTVITSTGDREFACSPVALVVFILNEDEKFLILSSPAKRQQEDCWETVSGAWEAGETVLQGALRETREEIGPAALVRPLGTVHAYTFHYDENVRYMISLVYVVAYEGGDIRPGDDMAGSAYKWIGLAELENEKFKLLAPSSRTWILRRAIELYRLWKDQDVDPVELGLHPMR
jgi:ADP-ribose pyrophosphatase YjhB (NUDIX family)